MQQSDTYQSSFYDYKPLSNENLSDWKSINVPSNDGGHAGHSMAGRQPNMTPEQMADMPFDNKEIPAMDNTGHSSMVGMEKAASDNMESMDHSQMKHDHAMAPMTEIDHSKMTGMDHGESDMKAMDHSNISESKPNDKQPSQEGAAQDVSQPHEHASSQASEHAGMSMTSKAPAISATPWQVIPNVHPIVVHFPIALTIIAFLLSIAAHARRRHPVSVQLAAAGHFTLWLAALGAATAVLFGWLAFSSVNHDDAGHTAMLLHRSWAIPTATGLILLASWDAWKYRLSELISVPMLFLLFLISQAIAVTGWLGGEVVYRHGIGVLSIPSGSAGHNHHNVADGTATPKSGIKEPVEMNNTETGESHEH